ncbi:MAG: glycosyltransferase [Anaerolineae bacterium]|nr:glycosyltransferase [Anaerolineae bacterium]
MVDLLIISPEVVGTHMAGPGIRYYQLARVLSAECAVSLAVPRASTVESAPFEIMRYESLADRRIVAAVRQTGAVLAPALTVGDSDLLASCPAPLIVDGYDPVLAETLSLGGDVVRQRWVLARAYRAGDFFICASERQRDWWLGTLEAFGRVNAHTHAASASLRALVDVVPFGLPDRALCPTGRALKGVVAGIGAGDKVVLWGGGLWPWLDPLTAIRAVARLRSVRPDVRLVFPGTRHPNPAMAHVASQVELAKALAHELGLVDSAVFFGDWVPYSEWQNVLAEADAALTLHADTVEARLAFRTRLLDCFWAGVPIVATQGDALSDLAERAGVGIAVTAGDADAVANALDAALGWDRRVMEGRFERARAGLTWEEAAQPLARFCRAPQRAPDKPYLVGSWMDPGAETEIARLRATVAAYERGKFIRLMAWLRRLGRRAAPWR